MVGDGINNAPSLARADVGLVLAGVGCDLAAESGSVILMGDPLTGLPETIRLARHTVRVIRQNILLFAFGLNSIAVVLAGLRILGPVAAAILHQVGSLLVLLNAIRIGLEPGTLLGPFVLSHRRSPGLDIFMYRRSWAVCGSTAEGCSVQQAFFWELPTLHRE